MTEGPVFFLLKWSAYQPASAESEILGAVVKDYRDPTDRLPRIPLDHNHHGLTSRTFTTFVVNSHSNNDKGAHLQLSSVAGIHFAGQTNNAVKLNGKLVTVKRLNQPEMFWEELKKNATVKAKVPTWVAERKRSQRPICVVVGILIAQDVNVCFDAETVAERKAHSVLPIGAISMASGIPLPIGDDANIEASIRADKNIGAMFNARSGESNIIALEVKPLTSKLWNRQKIKMEYNSPKDTGLQLGDEDDEDNEDEVKLEDIVLGNLVSSERS